MIKYIAGSLVLVIGWACSKLLGITQFEGITVGLVALMMFISEKLAFAYAVSYASVKKELVTPEDLNSIANGGKSNGSDE
jgi:hypothetical protein